MSRTLGENIVINFNQKPDIWPVVVDSAQLESSIVNLATNARDAMPKGGKLLIATTNQTLDADYVAWQQDLAAGDYVRIEVSDTGMGMSPQVKERIFEPFYTTKEQGKGTGLGLSMVFGFIKQSGGHISVYSEPDIGTTFRLYLPRATDVSVAAAEPAATEALPPGTGETVLVVEDNEALRHVVLRQIKDFGYRVLEADGATAALVILESEKVDLIFTDIVMPGDIDGITLAQRAVIRRPNLKIVLTSGFPDPRIISGFGAIASSVLLISKPYRKDKLAAVLRQALDK
jgi:CheY-like chemotaxis protein